ncbi:16S rRNA (cytidine(1402)-2'-O)-methyltransferase [Candidatus Roizmanbacteria bacterium CG22_combo_CG10-13_8_21_14_all_35_9]|uniref:16S rRNA (Cytidine(1402)-2'-O)-methyltransferase n=3 Tax=Candidatus Roizmaniibacteriota TaxID=1752723 RepID=A0A2M8F4B2_9BACT|nr:MAG: 16S rRNA (cytidine(1402)-2'-O)-methyltransferase [Candidatus Roizmanbacteria bacterium CG22_combo_CG10-13_8_21_14_all_35_9]PIY71089.1 MAG: 16S rRNA (cytidine(1402)-2'-O)-methyltransferase [Candidatus Roizmanbacteria bacterium CG_4_10_14_0_8_um_filter_35_28]PJC34091.1 MAG: 16S rRNA (cytidine(1402)-2'-O)-methyltransferase [Candidatus Roizmanbacteria bacterium CG_4_9_14_0_2_um_filter_35_15]
MLYIVSTPIGNLDDLSLRQAKTLVNSDIILAEDTRSAKILLDAIKQRFQFQVSSFKSPVIVSYYKEVEFEKLPEIISWLKQEKKVSLISESGSPLISDPGYLLVKTVIKEKLPLTIVPGPSAIISGLQLSGINPNQFMFLGFLPKKENQIVQLINQLYTIKKTFPEMVFVFYESPQRIYRTLQCFKSLEWRSEIVICREMTKKFEEIIRGKAEELLKRNYKGELTVVIQ